MNNQIPQCCQNTPTFLIEYVLGSKFHVCKSCLLLKHWSRGIKNKVPVTEIVGQGRPDSISEQELVTPG